MPVVWRAHSPGSVSFLRALRPAGFSTLLRPRKTPADAQALGVDPDLSGGKPRRFQIRRLLLRQIAIRHLPHFPSVVVVHDGARRHRQIVDIGRQIVAGVRQIPRVTRNQPALPMRQLVSGGLRVLGLGLAQQIHLNPWTIQRLGILQVEPEEFVALLQIRKLDCNFGEAIRMRIQQAHIRLAALGHRSLLRHLHGIQQRIEQIQ